MVASLRTSRPGAFGRILQLDIPGCGAKRGRDTSGLSRRDVVDELNAEVARAGVRGAMLVGHSAANMLLPDMARQGGDYAGLCVLAGPILRPGEKGSEIFGQGVHGSEPDKVGYPVDPRSVTAEELRRAMFCLDMTPAQAAAFLAECASHVVPRRMLSDPAEAFDPAALPPASYVLTRRNPVFPAEWQRRFAARLAPGTRLVEIDTGHEPFFTHPKLLAATLAGLYAA